MSIAEELAKPFEVGELKFFVVATTKDKTKGKVGSYIDSRAVMNRLDDVVGPPYWSTSYRVIDAAEHSVECELRVCYEGEWVSKSDVGYPNEARDADNPEKEPFKAAYSDALKRAAVQHGIGRYIYSLKLVRDWLPIDANGRFMEEPQLAGTAPKKAEKSPLVQAAVEMGAEVVESASLPRSATATEPHVDLSNVLKRCFPKTGGDWPQKDCDELMAELSERYGVVPFKVSSLTPDQAREAAQMVRERRGEA